LHLQTTSLDRIRAEAEESRQLAALNKEEADAVRKVIAATIEQAQGASAAENRRQQWQFFAAGVLLAIPLGVIGNIVYAFIIN
jgi:hypothetical protein